MIRHMIGEEWTEDGTYLVNVMGIENDIVLQASEIFAMTSTHEIYFHE